MFCQYTKGTAFSCGVQAVGCLVVQSILLETLAFCNSSNTDWNSLPYVENISSSIREQYTLVHNLYLQQSHNFKLFCNIRPLSTQFISLAFSFELSFSFSHFLHCHPNFFFLFLLNLP